MYIILYFIINNIDYKNYKLIQIIILLQQVSVNYNFIIGFIKIMKKII